MTSNDQVLIDRCLAGDRDAFGGLVDRYQDRLYSMLVRVLGSTHDALDVAQDAFVLAYQNLPAFRRDSAFYTWLFRIAYNAAISFRRKRKTRRASLDVLRDTGGLEPILPPEVSDPAAALEAEERKEQLLEALNGLADDHRDVLILKEMEGFRYDEIAELLGCPIGTVRSRLHRARIELREKLSRSLKTES